MQAFLKSVCFKHFFINILVVDTSKRDNLRVTFPTSLKDKAGWWYSIFLSVNKSPKKTKTYKVSVCLNIFLSVPLKSLRTEIQIYSFISKKDAEETVLTSPVFLSVHRGSSPSYAGSREHCRGWPAAAGTVWSPLWSPRCPQLHRHTQTDRQRETNHVSVSPI